MSSQVFDSIERTDTNPSYSAEPSYAYLNRSARSQEGKIRQLIDEWVSYYPESQKPDILSRLRSDDDPHFQAAFFELYVFNLLRCLGSEVRVHPDLPTADGRRPDFLVGEEGSQDCVVEVTWVTDRSDEEMAAEKRKNVVYDSINKLECTDFFLGMRIEGAPATPPPGRRLREQLKQWIHTLDYEQVSRRLEVGGLGALPEYGFHHEGWDLTFFPIPKSGEHRGTPTVRPLGLYMHGARWVDSKTRIRDAITNKGGRYGALDKPFVVALNADFHFDDDDVTQALFGTRTYVILDDRNHVLKPYARRNPDGAWTSPSGERYTRVSAVLIAYSIDPWSIASRGLRLFHNPRPKLPYSGALCSLPQAVLKGDRISLESGIHPRDVFGLPEGWPK